MKIYKVNKALYFIFPIFIFSVMLSYILILSRHSYWVVNVVNLSIDAVILLYYLFNFCFEVRMDSEGINFYTLFKKYRFRNEEIKGILSASFLTRVNKKGKRIYILTSQRGHKVLKEIFKDINRNH